MNPLLSDAWIVSFAPGAHYIGVDVPGIVYGVVVGVIVRSPLPDLY